MQVPSGRKFSQLDFMILPAMNSAGFIRYNDKPFRLKSGIESHIYVFGREDMTDSPSLEWLVGKKISSMLSKGLVTETPNQQVCLIGIPTAGTPFAQAAAMVSYNENFLVNRQPICHRVMKEVPKTHGAHHGWINGAPKTEHFYCFVDNVATDGASKPETVGKLKADGYFGGESSNEKPALVIWIDRQQGAVENLKAQGFQQILIAYNLLDITFAFGEMGFWPKSAVIAVEKEIREHQLKHTAQA